MIAGGWKPLKIGEIGRVVTGKTPSTHILENFGDKYPFITPRDMTGKKRISDTERYLSEKGKISVKNCLLPANAICVSCIGSDMGKVVMTSQDSITNQQLNSVVCSDSFNPDFVYYSIIKISDELRNAAHHSTAVPILNKSAFSDFEIDVPDLPTQTRIAAILSALDDKIEMNRQTNATLEAIAQAIFKEWFVDFRFPGATGEMQDCELGPIPKGWQHGKIKDFTKRIQYGLTQSASIEEIGPHFLRITDIQKGRINWKSVPYCLVDKKDIEKYKIENYDIVIARTGASTGENALVVNSPESVFASYLIRIQFEQPELALYVGKLLRRKQYFEFIDSIKSGSAQPNANAQQLTDFDILLPTIDILKEYFVIIEQVEQLKAEHQVSSTTLAQIRDILLPKLMSGGIEV